MVPKLSFFRAAKLFSLDFFLCLGEVLWQFSGCNLVAVSLAAASSGVAVLVGASSDLVEAATREYCCCCLSHLAHIITRQQAILNLVSGPS